MTVHRTARLLAGSAVVAMAVAVLTGCAGGGSASVAGCTPKVQAGEASQSITATGDFGAEPTVSFGTPIRVDAVQASPLIRGTGAPITAAQEIVADVTFLDATTGEVVLKTDYSAASAARFVVGTVAVTGLRSALVCAQVGERVAVVMPARQGIPAASRPTALSATDSVVAIVDIRKAYLARANGSNQVMGDGLPAVVLGPDGRPGITLPQDEPPTTLQYANLKKGSGAVVKRGETAVVQYTGVVWKPGDLSNGQVFDSSWANGAPVDLQVAKGQIIPGLVTALAGQRVGSQVIAVIPAKQAYGSQSTSTIPANATLVFVVDILGKV